MRKNFLMNTPDIRRKIVFTATKRKKTEGIVKLYVGSRHGHVWQSIRYRCGIWCTWTHFSFAAATDYVHRRYISILYQCTGCKDTGVQQAERKQQWKAWLDVLFKPEFNLGSFPDQNYRSVFFLLVKKRGILNSEKYQTHLSSLEKEERCMARRWGRMTWMLLDFQCVTPVPCGDISHFYCKRISASNNFAVLDRADKMDNVIFGMRQELRARYCDKVLSHIISTIFP